MKEELGQFNYNTDEAKGFPHFMFYSCILSISTWQIMVAAQATLISAMSMLSVVLNGSPLHVLILSSHKLSHKASTQIVEI